MNKTETAAAIAEAALAVLQDELAPKRAEQLAKKIGRNAAGKVAAPPPPPAKPAEPTSAEIVAAVAKKFGVKMSGAAKSKSRSKSTTAKKDDPAPAASKGDREPEPDAKTKMAMERKLFWAIYRKETGAKAKDDDAEIIKLASRSLKAKIKPKVLESIEKKRAKKAETETEEVAPAPVEEQTEESTPENGAPASTSTLTPAQARALQI
jgi:hypothetical protein